MGRYLLGATAATAAAGSLASKAEAAINFASFDSGPINDTAYVDLENLNSASNSDLGDFDVNLVFRPGAGDVYFCGAAEQVYYRIDFTQSGSDFYNGSYITASYYRYSAGYCYFNAAEVMVGAGGNALTFANVGDAVVDGTQNFYGSAPILPLAGADSYFVGYRINIVESDEIVQRYGWLELAEGSFILVGGAINTVGDGIEVGAVPESAHAAAFLAMGAAGLAAFRRKRAGNAA